MDSSGWDCMGGGLPGSGKVIAAGGGKPRCEVDMLWALLAGSKLDGRRSDDLGE